MRHPRARGARGSAHGENAPRIDAQARRRGRERADDDRGATRSSASAGSRSCPTCSRTPAASPSRTSNGCRISGGCSGTRDEIRARLADKLADAFDRVWMLVRGEGHFAAAGGTRRRHQRGRGCIEGTRDLSMTVARLRLAPREGNHVSLYELPFFRDRLDSRAAGIAAWAEENKRGNLRFPPSPLPPFIGREPSDEPTCARRDGSGAGCTRRHRDRAGSGRSDCRSQRCAPCSSATTVSS